MFKIGSLFYRFRGYILGIFALVMFLFPSTPLPKTTAFVDYRIDVLYLTIFLFYVIGISIRVFTRRYIGEHTRGKIHDAKELVKYGPYAYIRHPLYVSNFIIACGVILFHLGVSFYTIFFVFFVGIFKLFLSRMEDSFLESRFGNEWREWAKVTPAFMPCLTLLGKKKVPDFSKRSIWCAIKADFSTWLWLLIVNFFVLLLKLH